MDLAEQVNDIIRREVSGMNLNSVHDLIKYSIKDRMVLSALHKARILNDSDFEIYIKLAALETADKDYERIKYDQTHPTAPTTRANPFPDHLQYPEYFAYALAQKHFDPEELKKIKFDHGETPESFVKSYGKKNLIQYLKKEMLKTRRPKFKGGSGHCACSI